MRPELLRSRPRKSGCERSVEIRDLRAKDLRPVRTPQPVLNERA